MTRFYGIPCSGQRNYERISKKLLKIHSSLQGDKKPSKIISLSKEEKDPHSNLFTEWKKVEMPANVVPFDQLVLAPENRTTCPICQKTCRNSSTFRYHYMIHSGEKPEVCEFCPFRTIQRSALTRHINTVHGPPTCCTTGNNLY